jgi:hypothetical protein
MRILKESPLIEIYKNTRIQFEKMFCLQHKTTKHSPPKMKQTFAKLGEYMVKEKANSEVPGRSSRYKVPDAMGEGMNSFMMEKMRGVYTDADDDESELHDAEVEDDGDLDV